MQLRPDRVLGTLLGMAIGDALGMPVEGWPRERVEERYGAIDAYHPKTFEDGTELKAGEFTDDSEGVLCIVESFTANTGQLDAENIRARLEILARGESRRWMQPGTLAILDSSDGQIDGVAQVESRVTGDVAARGIALGLIAAGSPGPGQQALGAAASLLASVTHPSNEAAMAVQIVAEGVRTVALQETTLAQLPAHIGSRFDREHVATRLLDVPTGLERGAGYDDLAGQTGFGDAADQVIASAVLAAAGAEKFEDAVYLAASQGGAADSRAAIAGALAGAAFGAAGIPQPLIDGLEGRVYIMLAAPWFYQTIQLKSSFARSGSDSSD